MVPSLDCKINLSKNKILTNNQANTCIFEKFVVPLQHDFDYEECLSQHHIGGGCFIILKINELGVFLIMILHKILIIVLYSYE